MGKTLTSFCGLLFILILTFAVLTGCGGGGGGSSDGTTPANTTPTPDTTPPTVLSTTPANNATDVAVNSVFAATFSKPMDSTFLTGANFYINGLAADVSYRCSSAFLHPTSNLAPDTSYTVTITGVKDSDGNAIATPYLGTFSTEPAVKAIAAGDYHTVAIRSDGTLWAWGLNDSGQLGTSGGGIITRPTQIGTATNWSAIAAGGFHPEGSHTIALQADGTLWAWGANYFSQLGVGSAGGTFPNPTRIGTATDWSAIAAGSLHTIALQTDGTLWAWGENNVNQLGDGTTTNKNIPTQIGSATNWSAIAAGGPHTIARQADGTLWAWGSNVYGQLGDGTITNKSAPTQIGVATNWDAIAAGGVHTLALKADGTSWAWGDNRFGELGVGAGTFITPARIGTATDWNALAAGHMHGIGLKSDGTLWAWGYNNRGQLGDGTMITKFTPTQISFSSVPVTSAPTGVTATAGSGQVTVSWLNAAGATSYDIYYSTSSLVSATNGTQIACATNPFVITGLAPGTTYYVKVVASNGYGDSTPSSTASATTPSGSTGGGTYYWANWSCGTSSQCASAMGAYTGSTGLLCTANDCEAWKSTYFAGASCSTTAIYPKRESTGSNGVCNRSGVDF